MATNKKKPKPFVSSYSIQPKVGYEIGDVARDRPQRLIDNIKFQNYISRFLVNFDMAIEFRKFVTLSA